MKLNLTCYFIFIFLFPLALYAGKIDSTRHLIKVAGENEKSRLMHNMADLYFEADSLVQASEYYILAAELELRKENPDYMLVCESYGNAGYVFNQLDRYREAILYSQKCNEYAIKSKIPREESASLVNMGVSWFNLGDYEKSANMYLKAIDIDTQNRDTFGLSINYNNLGKIFEVWENYHQALDYYIKSLEMSILSNDSVRMAIRLSSVGMAYRGLKDYENALNYLNQALAIDKALGVETRLGTRFSNLGVIYQDMEENDMAQLYYNQAIELFRKTNSMRSLAIALNQLGNLYMLTNDNINAISALSESLEISETTQNLQLTMKNRGDLAALYENKGEFQRALTLLKQYHTLKDSIFNQKSLRSIEELKIKNEIDKSESEIILLKQEREIQDKLLNQARFEKISFLIFGLVAFGLLLIISRLYHQKIKITAELQNLNVSKDKFFAIISHDLKNPVSAFRNVSTGLLNALPKLSQGEIQSYVAELQNSAIHLNELLQNLLFWARSQTDMYRSRPHIVNTKNLIQKALESQHTSIHQKGLNVIVDLDGHPLLNIDENMVSTVLRNLISNAVRYSNPKGKIKISLTAMGNKQAVFHVADNGPGIEKSDIDKLFRIDVDAKTIGNDEIIKKGKGSGLGLILCQELLQKSGGKIWVSSEPEKGSTFSFTIPLN
jgi:signal transduction histidine kinase